MSFQTEQNRDRARQVFRSFTGREGMPVKDLARVTGISENQINADRDTLRDGSIPFPRLSIYGQIFGAPFWAAMIGPDGFAVFRTDRREICPRHHLTETLQFGGIFSEIMEDNIIDHREKMVVIPKLRDLGAKHFTLARVLEAA